jgi:hypothetical protein
MTKKTAMTKNVAGNVDEQPWTDAFEKRSTEGFEAALEPDVEHSAIHSLTHLSRKGRDANSNQGR